MTDREALAAALGHFHNGYVLDANRGDFAAFNVALAAARERLAQLSEKCGTCHGAGPDWGPSPQCPTCHGSGKVYPAELVERIAKVIADATGATFVRYAAAVAVLDVLNGETR